VSGNTGQTTERIRCEWCGFVGDYAIPLPGSTYMRVCSCGQNPYRVVGRPAPVSDPSETRQALQLIVDFHEQCFVRGVPLPVDTTKLQEAYSLAKRLLGEKER
jgi:hypothetical protein